MENVLITKKLFNYLKRESLEDKDFLEHFLIPHLGLNNEILNEQPKELSRFFGGGLQLKIWQYPNQFSSYLCHIGQKANSIQSYMEIGCRYGGTFITHCEYLEALGSDLKNKVAIDIIDEPEIISSYIRHRSGVEFVKLDSSSDEFINFIEKKFFDLVFIDGDHSYDGVKRDAENTRSISNIQVFHDIVNSACPGVVQYWNELKNNFSDVYYFHEFIDQYPSVDGTYLGIGVATRKEWINVI